MVAVSLLLLGSGCIREKVVTQEGGTTTTEAGGRKSDNKSKDAGSSGKSPGKVVATANTADGDIPLRVDLYELKRSGSVLAVNFGVTNLSTEDKSSSKWQISSFFDDGINNLSGTAESNVNLGLATTDGIYVIDEVNKKKYPVARDSSRRCLCDTALYGTFVELGQTVSLSATTGAPPADVKAVNISIPHVATFANVPLS